MNLLSFLRVVGLAVLISPVLTGLVGIALHYLRGEQSAADSAKVLLGLPITWGFAVLLGGIPALIGTGIAAAILAGIDRLVQAPVLLFGLAGIAAFVTMLTVLSRSAHGNGGTMQPMVEQFKAMLAGSIGVWCGLAMWTSVTGSAPATAVLNLEFSSV